MCDTRTACIDPKCIDRSLHILVCHYQSLVSLFTGPKGLRSRRPHSNCVYRTACIDPKCIDPSLHILVCHYQSLVSLFTGPKGLREPKATLELRVSNRSVLILAYIYWCVLPCWTDSSTSSSESMSKSRN